MRTTISRRLLLLDLGTQAILLLPQFGSQRRTEILGREHLADLAPAPGPRRVGAALDPLDRLFLRFHLPKPVAGDQLLRLGKRTIDHDPLVSREFDSGAFRAGMESLARQEY